MSMDTSHTPEARRKFVEAFHGTMIKIWKERVISLGAISTREYRRADDTPESLYRSIMTGYVRTDGDQVTAVSMGFNFNPYGIYVDRGTGRETPRGNPGDIGRAKVRKPKPWFQKKYFRSVYNLRDFFTESLAIQSTAIIEDTLGQGTIDITL